MKIKTLTPKDPDFPQALLQIPTPPKRIYVRGDYNLNQDTPRVAIVGSRKATPYGTQVTQHIVRTLARHNIAVISGLALGIDSVAHRAALEMGTPTIAVLPCGLDAVYPRSHVQLAKKILESGGALLSEYPEGTPPLRQHFIARNRLVSGLADALIVTEATEKSGTLHTANFALEQGKTVLAVPGNITSPLSQGTNSLLKAGAEPVTKPDDVLFALGIDPTKATLISGDTEEETLILSLVQSGITDMTLLQAKSKLDPVRFNQTLTMLEISGKLRNQGSGQWSLG